MFDGKGVELVFASQAKSNRKIDNEDLRRAIFSLLHEPPASHGINRTSWTMALLRQVLKENGTHASGWRWEFRFEGRTKTGVMAASRAAAIKIVESEIGRALKDRK
jgi:hypothetical protein